MRTRRRQLASLSRPAVVLAACAALLAMTSGLLLAIHLHGVAHPADHEAQDCPVCRHALVPSNKFLPDLARLSHYWLAPESSRHNDYCERADANRDGAVNFVDFARLASNWRGQPQ